MASGKVDEPITREPAAPVCERRRAVLGAVFPESHETVDEGLARAGQWEGELRHTRKDGTVIVVSNRQALQRGPDGQPLAIIGLNSDITERKRAEAERERATVELQEAEQIACLGSWHYDPASGTRTLSAGMYQVYGRDPAGGPIGTEESLAWELEDELVRCDRDVLRHHCPGHDFSRWVSGVFRQEVLAAVIAAAEAGVQETSPAAVVEQARVALIAALQARHFR